MNIHNNKILKERRKNLRNNLTSAEALMWTLLKNKQVEGRKFRRQQSIGSYIVDFFCYEENLVIEVDGSIHNDPVKMYNDKSKDEFLVNNGFNVLRIMNAEVFADTNRVVNKIISEFKENK